MISYFPKTAKRMQSELLYSRQPVTGPGGVVRSWDTLHRIDTQKTQNHDISNTFIL